MAIFLSKMNKTILILQNVLTVLVKSNTVVSANIQLYVTFKQ